MDTKSRRKRRDDILSSLNEVISHKVPSQVMDTKSNEVIEATPRYYLVPSQVKEARQVGHTLLDTIMVRSHRSSDNLFQFHM